MNKQRIENEKKLYKRLIISYYDLDHALKYADLILNKNLHWSELEEDKYLIRGLNTALIVSYWRPFSANHDSHKDTCTKLSQKYIKNFTPNEKKLHKRIGELRDRDIAHSDSTGHNVNVIVNDNLGFKQVWSTSRNAISPLSREETELMKGMI